MTFASPLLLVSRAYRVRLLPKPEQERLFHRFMSAKRVIWNWAWTEDRPQQDPEHRHQTLTGPQPKLSPKEMSRKYTERRQVPEGFSEDWWKSIPRDVMQQVLRDYETAWQNYFDKRANRPKKKKYRSVKTIRFPLDQRNPERLFRGGEEYTEKGNVLPEKGRGWVQLVGVGKVKFKFSEALKGKITSVTVQKEGSHWYASLTASEVPVEGMRGKTSAWNQPASAFAAGDLGLTTRLVHSNGTHHRLENRTSQRLMEKHRKLRRYQRRLSRQQARAKAEGRTEKSRREQQTIDKIQDLHAEIKRTRRHQSHELTTQVLQDAECFILEDLNVKGMAQGLNAGFKKSVAQAALGEILRQFEYKAQWYGRTIVTVDRWFPSSKRCSHCHYIHKELKLKDRQWECPHCQTYHQRDDNAAANLLQEGIRLSESIPRSVGEIKRCTEEHILLTRKNSSSLTSEPIVLEAATLHASFSGLEPAD